MDGRKEEGRGKRKYAHMGRDRNIERILEIHLVVPPRVLESGLQRKHHALGVDDLAVCVNVDGMMV